MPTIDELIGLYADGRLYLLSEDGVVGIEVEIRVGVVLLHRSVHLLENGHHFLPCMRLLRA